MLISVNTSLINSSTNRGADLNMLVTSLSHNTPPYQAENGLFAAGSEAGPSGKIRGVI